MTAPVRRMINYSGLAQGQGPVTMTTSPLWSPYGPYSMNRSQFGAIAYQGFHGEADGADEGMMGTIKGYYEMAKSHQTMGYPTWMLVGGAYAAYMLWMNRGRFMPVRANRWDAMSNTPGVARNMAKLRWGYATGDTSAINPLQKFFANLAGMKITPWRTRRGKKLYGPYTSSLPKTEKIKPMGIVESIVAMIEPQQDVSKPKSRKASKKISVKKSVKKSTKLLPAKKASARLTKSDASLKALRARALKLRPKYGLKKAWEIARSEIEYANVKGNPKRRRSVRRRR